MNTKNKAIYIEILDYRQCFDSMWLEEVINDLFEAGINNSNLAIIYEANTEIVEIERIVMQGETLAPLECSVQVDKIGNECMEEDKFLYYYKNEVPVPPLSMVDDLVAISNCGVEAVKTNAFLNGKTNLKK